MSTELFNHIDTSDRLHHYLKIKGENHNYYKFYTNETIVKSILDSSSIYLSKGERWNDIQDRVNFNPDDDRVVRFGLCMSFAKSESVAMWMLYGRNDGYMIDFRKDIIKQCLKSTRIECGRIRESNFQSIISLHKSKFSIEVVDVIYYSESDDKESFYIKRSDEVVQNCKPEIINEIRYCKKTLPWQYECECRLIVTITKSVDDIGRCDTVKIAFNESSLNELKKRIYHSPNHKEDFSFEKSKLNGKIEWNIE